jgi:ATP-dependent RNA helicase DHX37/DHR1
MEEIHKLRSQISSIVETNFSSVSASFLPTLQPPNELQLKILRQLLASAFIDQVAIRKDLVSSAVSSGAQYATSNNVAYRALDIEEDLFIHPSSILATRAPPEYVVFCEVVRTTRVWMKGPSSLLFEAIERPTRLRIDRRQPGLACRPR